MFWILAFILVLIVALVATRAVMGLGISDSPDAARKNHQIVTPTSGGIAIMIAVWLGVWFAHWQGVLALTQPVVIALLVSSTAGILGLLDDIFVLGAKTKLAAMLVLVGLFVVFGARIERFELTGQIALSLGPIIGGLGTILWLLVMVNTVNFMDGANGMAMGCAGIGLLGLTALIVFGRSQPFEGFAIIGWIGFAACLGFLYWNALRGKVFAGDSGALFVGLLCATFGILAVNTGISPVSVAMCFLPMLVDVILTIIGRVKRAENVLLPHSRHAYQNMIRHGSSHLRVSSRYWLHSLICCIGAIAMQGKGEGTHTLIAFGVLTLALALFYYRVFAQIRANRAAELLD
jgi:UDP-GlcNAc:undecaprenyl-phosphate/decaprenyl-phosphate GlcNAc-1-phosphate transferase